MDAKFYKMNLTPERINKPLTNETSMVCRLKGVSTVENPVLEISYSPDIMTKNYFYIPDFDRYYFITDKTINGHIVEISGHVDVLMSFKNDILNANGTATRSNFKNNLIIDNLVLDLPKQNVQYRQLSAELTGESYILIVGG